MAGGDENELNEIRIALGNVSDDQGEKAIDGLEKNDDGTITIEHRPSATDEITDRMSDHGYAQDEHLSEGEARREADAATGHVVTVFSST